MVKKAEGDEMKLEVGKKYICRNAPDVKYVLIVYDTLTDDYQVLGIAHYADGKRTGRCFTLDGSFYENKVSEMDLIAEYKEPKKYIRYFNLYSDDWHQTYVSRQLADAGDLAAHSVFPRIACVKVTLTEGVWDD